MAWREPLWQNQDPRWFHSAGPVPLLTADEFLLLYAALPTPEAIDRAPAQALEQLLQGWARQHPEVAAREPARTILANMKAMAASKDR
jgi:hypothetical protein